MLRQMQKITRALAVAAGLVLVMTPVAHADQVLDFGMIAPTSGTIKYATVGGTLTGTGIQVDNVTGLGTPLNPLPQPRTCFNCVLSFSTGNIVSESSNEWVFSGGGSITITGQVDLDGDNPGGSLTGDGDADTDDGAPITLLTGHFVGAVTVLEVNGTMKIFGAGFTDTKNASLLALYGLPQGIPYNGAINLSFLAPGTPHNGSTTDTFTSTSLASGDVLNSPTPEPASLLLLGSGLIGFGYLAVRRRRGTA